METKKRDLCIYSELKSTMYLLGKDIPKCALYLYVTTTGAIWIASKALEHRINQIIRGNPKLAHI